MNAGAWFTWLDGRVEAVEVHAVRDGRAFVSWPESRRIVDWPGRGRVNAVRPESWLPVDRITVSCSAGIGGDPVSGCDTLAPFGQDYCPQHA